MSTQEPYRIMISGGGTGGHIYPAIAIANALKAKHSDTIFLFVGAKGRMEMDKVPQAGFEIVGLWISGIQRKLSLDNLSFPFKLISSVFRSFQLLKKFKPHAVVGVGGYASGPLLYAAGKKKIPSLIQEQNSYAGMTNKWLAKSVNKVCVAYDGMDQFFPDEKIIHTGNPVRAEICLIEEKRDDALRFFDLDKEKKTLLVIGGSLGARTINEAMISSVGQLLAEDAQVIWQCGKHYFEEVKERTAHLEFENLKVMPFIERMDFAYAAADVVISRAGALSISELCLVGKAVIFIPSPNVAEDHQTKNAHALVEKKAAILVKDSEAMEEMIPMAMALLEAKEQCRMLSDNLRKLAKPDAAKDISKEILDLIQ